jgi:hypothetical protein
MPQMQCDNCKGYKMKFKPPINALTFIGGSFTVFGLLGLFIGVFIWPLLPIAAILLLLGSVPTLLGWLVAKDQIYKCRNCGFTKTIPAKKP